MLKPIRLDVIVKRDDRQEVTESGIHIPNNAQEAPQFGTVVAISELVIDVEVGDRIMFGKYDGVPVDDDGVEYLVLDESDIMAVVE